MKKSILYIALDLIFLVVFNTIFFLLKPEQNPASVWISYCFIHLAYIMVVITPILTNKGKSSSIFGMALATVSAVYFFAVFIVGILFILAAPEDFKACLIVQVILAAAYGILLLINLIANESTAEKEAKREKEILFVKTCSAKLKLAIDNSNDKEVKKAIEKAYDEVYNSPVKTDEAVRNIEMQIYDMVSKLYNSVDSKEEATRLANEIVKATRERNITLKTVR